MVTLWLQFLVCSGLIVLCGVILSRYGDVIAEKTGMGRARIGWDAVALLFAFGISVFLLYVMRGQSG